MNQILKFVEESISQITDFDEFKRRCEMYDVLTGGRLNLSEGMGGVYFQGGDYDPFESPPNNSSTQKDSNNDEKQEQKTEAEAGGEEVKVSLEAFRSQFWCADEAD